MSFAIAVYVREGIVMAADSRLTLSRTIPQSGGPVVQLAVGQTDSNQKLFLARNDVGIATYGDADIKGVPIAGFIESFLETALPEVGEVEDTAKALLAFFQKLDPVPATHFLVAGYAKRDDGIRQEIWLLDVRNGSCVLRNPPGDQGATWGGEVDILTRLVQPLAEVDTADKIVSRLPVHAIPWGFFTLQDAIDFAIFATRSTIDAIRFQPRPKTVGGPIDVLVMRQKGCQWIQRKELHGDSVDA